MLWAGASALAVAASAASWAGEAHAQAPAADVSEVVVTGSFIRGTPEDAALPVDVIGAEELARQGSPSTVDLIKALPASQGVLGDSNQFDGATGGTEGIGTVNLRGLGAARTLVLLNGRRLSPSSALNGAVDTNSIPVGAIGRIEVLKDGAAATYGSEAIGGVVNFITPTTFDGLSANAYYNYIDGSDGDWGGGLKWGWTSDSANVFLSFNYAHRSELRFLDRDFTNLPYAENPEGGYSSNNLAQFVDMATGQVRRDTGCARLGGTETGVACQLHFALNDNLIEPEDKYQVYGQVNFDLSDKTRFHLDVMYSQTNVLMKTTSHYALLATPTATFSATPGRYFVPASNPGLIDYVAKNPSQFPNGNQGISLVAYRPMAFSGNPLFDNGIGASEGKRRHQQWRVSGDLTGEFENGIGWNVALTYSQTSNYLTQYDSEISRFQLALNGLGGPNCDYRTGTPGVGGCMYYSPLSNSDQSSPIFGATNSQFTSTSPRNSKELINWFYKNNWREYLSRIVVAEASLNGKIGGFELPGGEIGWAFGGQFRRNILNLDVSDGWNDKINPCADSPITGVTQCAVKAGPLVYLGTFNETDLEQNVYATFAELQIPFTDRISAQLAARYEDYGGQIGSSFDPKLSVRWEINDVFALRGSVGTTFRAPPGQLREGRVTSLQFFGGNFRPVDIVGNPDLEPESATTYSVGAMVKVGGLRATLDYWNFDFDKQLIAEPYDSIVSAMFPGGSSANCGNAAYAALQSRFTFNGGVCSLAATSRLRTSYINGPKVKTSGIDALADFDFPQPILGGDVAIGGSLAYVLEYKVGSMTIDGLPVQPAYDAVGKLNVGRSVTPIPQWKAQFYLDYTNGVHNLRLTGNFVSSYIDDRASIIAPNANLGGARVLRGQKIKENLTIDAAYRVFLPWESTMTVRVQNIFNQDPSFARLATNYDPWTGSPLGRTIKLSLEKKF